MVVIRAGSTVRVFVLFVGLFFNSRAFAQNTSKSGTVVQAGSVVSFEYTLRHPKGWRLYQSQ